MKKIISLIMFLLMVGVVSAIPEPTLTTTIDMNDEIESSVQTNFGFRTFSHQVGYSGDNAVILTNLNSSGTSVFIYQISTGSKLFEGTLAAAGATGVLTTVEDYAVVCYKSGVSGQNIAVFDITNLGFITKVFDGGTGHTSASSSNCFIGDIIGSEINIFYSAGNRHIVYNTGNDTITQNNAMVQALPSNVSVVDTQNKVFGSDTKLYQWTDVDPTNYTEIYDMGTGNGNFLLFNGDEDNPLYFTTTGNLVIAGDYSSPQVTGTTVPNTQPLVIFNQEQIYGELSNVGRISGFNFSDVINPQGEIFSELLLSNQFSPSSGHSAPTDVGGLFASYDGDGARRLQLWSVDILLDALTANNPPLLDATFLGTDINKEDFVFQIGITDADGGSVYHAIDVDLVGEFSLGDQDKTDGINFDTIDDLERVSAFGFCNDYNITFASGITQFDIDGSLFFNTSSCLGPLTIDTNNFYSDNNDNINVTSSFFFENPLNVYPMARTYSLRNAEGLIISQLIFNQTDANNMQIEYWNGTDEVSLGTFGSFPVGTEFVFVRSEIDFISQEVTHTLRRGVTGTIMATTTVDFLNTVNSFGEVSFGSYSVETGNLYIDNVDISYLLLGDQPQYLFFENLQRGQTVYRDIRVPINHGFNDYEFNSFATDDIMGFDNYSVTVNGLFTYNNNTQSLTEAEISELINGVNQGQEQVFEEGDFITDLLPSFTESIGFKTVFSQMLVGFGILLLVIGFMNGYPVEAQILVVTIAFLILTIWGFFPAWLLVIVIVIAVALFARAMSRLIGGGSN